MAVLAIAARPFTRRIIHQETDGTLWRSTHRSGEPPISLRVPARPIDPRSCLKLHSSIARGCPSLLSWPACDESTLSRGRCGSTRALTLDPRRDTSAVLP